MCVVLGDASAHGLRLVADFGRTISREILGVDGCERLCLHSRSCSSPRGVVGLEVTGLRTSRGVTSPAVGDACEKLCLRTARGVVLRVSDEFEGELRGEGGRRAMLERVGLARSKDRRGVGGCDDDGLFKSRDDVRGEDGTDELGVGGRSAAMRWLRADPPAVAGVLLSGRGGSLVCDSPPGAPKAGSKCVFLADFSGVVCPDVDGVDMGLVIVRAGIVRARVISLSSFLDESSSVDLPVTSSSSINASLSSRRQVSREIKSAGALPVVHCLPPRARTSSRFTKTLSPSTRTESPWNFRRYATVI